MTDKISGLDSRPVHVSTERKVGRSEDSASNATSAASPQVGAVHITDQARQMAALEQKIESVPVINEARVAELRRAIEEGRYEINPERIADKLLRSERELGL